MLILSRHINESIVIGDNIVITILKVEHGSVKLGVTAPREVPVNRAELQPIQERQPKENP